MLNFLCESQLQQNKRISVCRIIHSSVCVCIIHPGSFLDSSSALLAVAACTALGEIGRNGTLLIPVEGEGFTKLSTVDNLLARIPSGKESTKVTRRTITSSSALYNVPYYIYTVCNNGTSGLQLNDMWLLLSLSHVCVFFMMWSRWRSDQSRPWATYQWEMETSLTRRSCCRDSWTL